MFRSICTSVFGLAIVLVLVNLAGATVINADLQDATSASNAGTFSGQGAYADAGNNYWTAVGGNGSTFAALTNVPLSDSTGAATTATFSIARCQTGKWTNSINFNALLGDGFYVDSGHPIITFSIGGLVTGNSYTLYLYSAGNLTQGGSFSLDNGTTYPSSLVSTSANGYTAYSLGNNYVVGTVTANGSGQILGAWKTNGTTQWGGFNGFQLIGSLAPVPEPSTLALLAAGLSGLLCYAWRKRK
jgi:hypothetical protein